MKEPLFQHIYLKEEESYNILHVNRPYFVVPWHMHPEIEIMHIINGEGNRFVGDGIENYGEGDLVIVGSNLPHCWKSGQRHYQPEKDYKAQARVILFKEENFGKGFFNISEFKAIKDLFIRAQRGVCFNGETKISVTEKIAEAYLKKGVQRFMAFIDILNCLAESREYRFLASADYKSNLIASDMQRLNKVFDYLMMNYHKPLRLDEIAAKAYMSPTAFCRYFKTHTNKTVFNFLTELRIGSAKKMLLQNKTKISEIHFLCGFHNSSNFYGQFKKIAGCSPYQFKKQHEAKFMDDNAF